MAEFLVTSGYNFEGYRITKYLGFCSGECALGTGFLSSFGASFADFLGSNSSMYEGKLSRAKNMAISELQRNAAAMGANAIIGLDVDYTTFTSDIMGVVANGTAIRIEKMPEEKSVDIIDVHDLEVVKKDNETLLVLPVINYYEDLLIRPVDCTYNISKKEMCLGIYIYNAAKVEALNVDIIGNTVFGTSYDYKDINFTNFTVSRGEIQTETVPINILNNQLKVIKSIYVKINYCIIDGKVYSLGNGYKTSRLDNKKLIEFRNQYGKDVVDDFRENSEQWICMCGKENIDKTQACTFCERKYKVYGVNLEEGEKDDTEKIKTLSKGQEAAILKQALGKFEYYENSKAIYEYLIKMEKWKSIQFSEELMLEVKKCVETEKLYGNTKNDTIVKIKAYISE